MKTKERGHLQLAKAALVGLASAVCVANAYEIETHFRMSQISAQLSKNLLEQLPNLGLRTVADNLSNGRQTFAIQDWFGEGARREDDTISEAFARHRNHFFDPRANAPRGGGFTGVGIPGVLAGLPAPDWALEPTNHFVSNIFLPRRSKLFT